MITDPLAAAITASQGWYELIFDLHGRRFRLTEDLWIAQDAPPPWHSGAITQRPSLSADEMIKLLGDGFAWSVADTHADLDLSDHGYVVLFDATWIHAPAIPSTDHAIPPNWSVITTPAELAEWSDRHDYLGVLPAAALQLPELRILARTRSGQFTGGAVLHRTDSAVGVSNVWAEGDRIDWTELMIIASHLYPGRDLVGYERDQDLTDAMSAGFVPVGPHRVWHPT